MANTLFFFFLQSLISICFWYSLLECCCSSVQTHSAGNFSYLCATVRIQQDYDILLTIFLPYMKESSLLLLCWDEHRHDRLSHHPLFHFGTLFAKGKVFHYPQISQILQVKTLLSHTQLLYPLCLLFPQKSPFYVLIVGGWSFSLYAIQLVCRNLNKILQEHWHVALGTDPSLSQTLYKK